MVLRIRRPKGITSTQLMVVIGVGVIAGSYIWQPLLIRYKKEQIALKNKFETEAKAESK